MFTAFLSFCFSLRLVKNKNVPKYLKGFYLYPMVCVLVAIPFIFPIHLGLNASIINSLSLIFHFTYLSYFISKVLNVKKLKQILVSLFAIFFCIITVLLWREDLNEPVNYIFSISAIGLTIFSILYYYQIFISSPLPDLLKEPSFWIVTGVFFSMSLHIPISMIIDELFYKIPYSTYLLLSCILVFSIIIMHLFFIKAFLCVKKR